jgi:transposase-like protein
MKAVRLKEVSPLDDLRALAKVAHRAGRKVPEELKARAVELFVDGYSVNEVAIAAGVHVTSLYKWARDRASGSTFRTLDLIEATEERIESESGFELRGAPTRTPASEGIVFQFPRGTSVVLPSTFVTPSIIEAFLCFEREVRS